MATVHFKGKSYVQNHHLTLKYHHLVPNPAASLMDKISLHDNLIIHGDNLLALKALLPTYAGKVKGIYANSPVDKEDLARELGEPVEMQAILEGDSLPAYEDLARYVFYTATGDEFDLAKVDQGRNFIGDNKDFEVYLLYQPDLNYLRSTALDLGKVEKIGLPEPNCKKRLVFAPMKYLDTDTLERYRIEYCQLPFEIYKFKD
jgi:hypothetical protein